LHHGLVFIGLGVALLIGISGILRYFTIYAIMNYKMEKKTENRCSVAVCTNKHEWPLQLALAKCPGCNGFVVARKLENCPNCNEPAEWIELRVDHLAGNQVGPACKGTIYSGYSGIVRLERTKGEQEKLWEATLAHGGGEVQHDCGSGLLGENPTDGRGDVV
jgi:hypothetical protein